MKEFMYKQFAYTTVESLKNSLAMGWEDGIDVIFGMDRGGDIEEFDERLYQAFRRANDRIEAGENADKVFFDFIYDGYAQPEQLYWRNASYFWKPEQESISAVSGVGHFILKVLWYSHPGYDLWRDFEEGDTGEQEEAVKILLELLENGCLSLYMKGCPAIISDEGIAAMEKAEQLYKKGEDIKSRDIARHEMIDNLYQAGYEMFGHQVLVTDNGTYENIAELREAMKEKLNQSVNDYVAMVRSLMQETFIDQRFYNWLVYTRQLEKFYEVYGIKLEG